MSVTSSIFDNSRALLTLLQNLERLKHSFLVCDLFLKFRQKEASFTIFRAADAKFSAFRGSEDLPLARRRALADLAMRPQSGALDVAAADRPELQWQAERTRFAFGCLLTGRRSVGERGAAPARRLVERCQVRTGAAGAGRTLRPDGPPAWHRRCAERRARRALHGPGLDYGVYSVTAVKHKSEQRDLNSKNFFPRLLFAENGLRFTELQPRQHPQIYFTM